MLINLFSQTVLSNLSFSCCEIVLLLQGIAQGDPTSQLRSVLADTLNHTTIISKAAFFFVGGSAARPCPVIIAGLYFEKSRARFDFVNDGSTSRQVDLRRKFGFTDQPMWTINRLKLFGQIWSRQESI
jgi:hypothetical protein